MLIGIQGITQLGFVVLPVKVTLQTFIILPKKEIKVNMKKIKPKFHSGEQTEHAEPKK